MKKLWIITGAVVIVAAVGSGIFFFSRKQATVISPGSAVSTPTPAPVDLTTWTDEAGFTFRYPKDLAVDKNEEDPDNYAHVELTHKDHPGKVIVWVSDLPKGVTTLDSWVKKLYSGGTALDTMLGGEPAKKILTTAPVRMLTVGAISDNLLFYIEGTLTDQEYWTGVHDTVSSSFAFSDGTTSDSSGDSSEAPVSEVDEEEVVQ